MSDLISRQAAIGTLAVGKDILRRVLDDMDIVGQDRDKYSWGLGLIESYIDDIKELPSVQPEPTYEQIKEYCHKRCLSIVDNALLHKYAQAEIQPEIIHCKDCKYADDDYVCQHSMGLVIQDDDDYCSYAKRRADEHDK